jgi:hypothetical protein
MRNLKIFDRYWMNDEFVPGVRPEPGLITANMAMAE